MDRVVCARELASSAVIVVVLVVVELEFVPGFLREGVSCWRKQSNVCDRRDFVVDSNRSVPNMQLS